MQHQHQHADNVLVILYNMNT